MTFPAKSDQVGLCVATKGTPRDRMVDIEILRASTLLKAPTITFQDFSSQLRIYFRSHPNSRSFLRGGIIHVPDPLEKPAGQTPVDE